MRTVPLAVLFALALLSGCLGPGAGTEQPAPAPTTAADGTTTTPLGPAWSFTDTAGATITRDGNLGHPTVLFFMATWCSTCRSNTPRLATIQDEFAAQGLKSYSLSIEPNDDKADLEDWKARYDNPWPHGNDAGLANAKLFGVTSQSSIVVLDGHGNPVKQWGYGGASESDLRKAVQDAFARA
ncbi:MAG: TlpA disulfide reductase family protein [Candidatus Thermoplasmatota archaeon]